MPNEKNLIPMDQRSKSEARELGRNGGIASGASRRRKRSLKEAADLYLSLPVSDRRVWNKIARKGVDPKDIDNQMAMIIGLTMAPTTGDAKAAKVIVDLLGERVIPEGVIYSMFDPAKHILREAPSETIMEMFFSGEVGMWAKKESRGLFPGFRELKYFQRFEVWEIALQVAFY